MSISPRGRTARLSLAFAVIALAFSPQWASAHAEYERSEPGAGATVRAPERLDVWFSQELFRREGANALEVTGPDGTRVEIGPPLLDDADRTHLSVELAPDLAPGVYTVRWRTLSATDGDPGEGEFTFTVDPAAPEATPPATGSPDAASTVEVTPPAPAASSRSGSSEFPWWALGAAGAIIVSGSIVALTILRDGDES